MTTKRVRLRDVCRVDRVIVGPGTSIAKDLPYLGLENVASGTGQIVCDSPTDGDDLGISATFRFDSRHVLYGKLRPYLNKVALPSFSGRCTTEIIPIRPGPSIERDYLALVMRTDEFIEAGMRSAAGSRMPRANVEELLEFEFELPANEDQLTFISHVSNKLKTIDLMAAAATVQVRDASSLTRALLHEVFRAYVPISVGRTDGIRPGWQSFRLAECAQLHSGHTPSRRRPEWWGGSIPWLALPDIRKLHGQYAHATIETTNELGLANSSARLLPAGTVCVCRDASVGYVTILGRAMATSQHFCNWVCNPDKLDPEFLMYAFMASQEYLRELSSGSVIKTIYMPVIESFHICAPDLNEQKRIARRLRDRLKAAEALSASLKARLADIEHLPQRLLAEAFGT